MVLLVQEHQSEPPVGSRVARPLGRHTAGRDPSSGDIEDDNFQKTTIIRREAVKSA